METLKNFGKRIKELRKAQNLTQEKLAELVNLEQKQICHIENGVCFTTYETLIKIAKVLNVEVFDLFYCNHKKPKDALVKELNEIFTNASDKQIELIYKFAKSIMY